MSQQWNDTSLSVAAEVSRETVWRIRKQRTAAEPGTLAKLAAAMNVPPFDVAYEVRRAVGDAYERGEEVTFVDTQLPIEEGARLFAHNRSRMVQLLSDGRERYKLTTDALLVFIEAIARRADELGKPDEEFAETLRQLVRQGGI